MSSSHLEARQARVYGLLRYDDPQLVPIKLFIQLHDLMLRLSLGCQKRT